MDTIDLLKAFIATARTGSFTGGAERLGISNRLTSKYIAELEARLNTRVLQRTTRRVGLTPAGQNLLARAPLILNELDDLMASVAEDTKTLSGIMRVSAPVTIGENYFKDLLSRFALLHPNLTIDLHLSDAYIDLATNAIDVAFRVGIPDISSLKVRKLGMLTNSLVAAPSYLAEYGEPQTVEELGHHMCIIDTNRRDAHRWTFMDEGREVVINPQRRFMVNSGSVARDWAVMGHGITLCPDYFLQQEVEEGKLVRILERYEKKTVPINAIYLEGSVLPTKVRALIDFTLEDIKDYPGLCG